MTAMSGNDFLKWATPIGLTTNLPPEAFKKLLTPQLVPCWRQIFKHVKPKNEADTVRKNILLNKLRNDKLSGKLRGKLPVKINRVSQIDLVKNHERLTKKIEGNSAEITSLTDQIKDLNVELNKMGKTKKSTSKSLEDANMKVLLLREKEKHFKKLLNLKDCTEQMKSVLLPRAMERPQFYNSFQTTIMPSSSLLADNFQPQCNSSFRMEPSQSVEVDKTLDELDKLADLMNELSPSELFDDPESRKEKLHNYVWEHFRKTAPSILMESLTAKLCILSKELSIAARTKSTAEEMNSIMNELEVNGCKTFTDSVKDLWLSAQDVMKEVVSLQNSTFLKQEELLKKKKEVFLLALKTTTGANENDLKKWIDVMVENILVRERVKVLDEEIMRIHLDIENLEDTSLMFFELDQTILKCEHNIKCEKKELETKMSYIKKKAAIKKVDESKKKIVAKITDYQLKHKEQTLSGENSDPFSCLRNFVKNEVLLLQKLPIEALQLVRSPKHITEDTPLLPLYSPYCPVHFILLDILEKFYLKMQSISALEELQPSPPIVFDINHLIEETKSIEMENESMLKENIAELNQILEKAKENIEEAAKSISYWEDSPIVDFIPSTILIDGLSAKSWREKISKYLSYLSD